MIQLVWRIAPISPLSTISLIFWYSGLLRWLNMMAKVSLGVVAAYGVELLDLLGVDAGRLLHERVDAAPEGGDAISGCR